MQAAGGPFFEDLRVGQVERLVPAITLTAGHAAVHQAIVGDRLRLALDHELSRRVCGGDAPLAHPALVWDTAIGQSTVPTQRVVANLFYRGLVFHRAPRIGDTLTTVTEVVALRENAPRAGRAPTGLAALRIRTNDQHGRRVLDFWRCAMLPRRSDASTGHADDLDGIPAELDPAQLGRAIEGWSLRAFGETAPAPAFAAVRAGDRWRVEGGDVVSGAPELARLSLNLAAVHHDRGAARGERRLVYGGHTIALAAAQAARLLPGLVTIVGWHGCDHLAPVHEGDTLRSELEAEAVEPREGGGGLVHLRSRVRAERRDGSLADVLDWRFVAALA